MAKDIVLKPDQVEMLLKEYMEAERLLSRAWAATRQSPDAATYQQHAGILRYRRILLAREANLPTEGFTPGLHYAPTTLPEGGPG